MNPFTSDVDVWAIESVFVHVTVAPTATFTSSGVYALFASDAAPAGIATDDDGPPVVGVGDGTGDGEVEGDDELPPQAIASSKKADTTERRNDNIRSSECVVNKTSEVMILTTRRSQTRFTALRSHVCNA